VLLCVGAFGLTASHFNGWHGAGDLNIRPTRIADVRPVYQHTAGDMTVDLRALSAASGTVTTTVKLSAGDVTVLVPPTAEVEATCSASVGDVQCLDQHDSGPGNPTLTASQPASAGSNLKIVLNVQDGTGQVEVANHD
jgi:predicted membrane protein